ncbi:MAG: TnpV protein [Clostridia bacterium]|nr:TnpV protein [Clostridia bacterium]
MERSIHDEKNGLDYELVGDYYIPCLKVPEPPKVGRFGMMYHDYLRKYKRVAYSGLILSGKLKEQIEEVDRQAEEMFSRLVKQMAKAEGVTEKLKATEQTKWVGMMNSIRKRVEEIVKSEVLFV